MNGVKFFFFLEGRKNKFIDNNKKTNVGSTDRFFILTSKIHKNRFLNITFQMYTIQYNSNIEVNLALEPENLFE